MFADDDRAAWRNPRVLTTLLLVFLTGAISGAVAMRSGIHGFLHPRTVMVPGTQLSYDVLKKDLNLTEKQAESIRMVLDDTMKYNEDLQHQIEDVRATGKNRIIAVLTPDQKERFERLCDKVQPR